MKHPLYTAVALLVLPWLGFLLNTWLGALVGVVPYNGQVSMAVTPKGPVPAGLVALVAADRAE